MKLFLALLVLVVFALNLHAAEEPKVAKGKLTSIQGIAGATEAKLNAPGVTTVDELLEKGATPKGREELAAKSGVSAAQILKFVNYADFFRIKGIASQTAELLEAELPRLEALNEPDDAAGEVEELNGFFRRYALAA